MAPLPDLPDPPDVPDLTVPEERDRWTITDVRKAEWVMRKLAHAAAWLADLDEQRAEYDAQIADWYNDAASGAKSDVAWAEAILAAWAIRVRETDPDAKTQQLPSGRVSTRANAPRLSVRDAGRVAETLARARHPDYDTIVHATVTVDARALERVVTGGDEWLVRLDCGCTVSGWHAGPRDDLGVSVGQEWPWQDYDHEPRHSPLDRVIRVRAVERGRTGVPVVTVREGDGVRVVPLDGVEVIPGRITASVQVR